MVAFVPDNHLWFPPIENADEDGLVAITLDFSIERILLGYQSGLFPWFEKEGLYHWFAPNPRCVLFPNELKVSKSMKQVLKKNEFTFRINTSFVDVMINCANVARKPVFMNGILYPNDSTWITQSFLDAYSNLQQLGFVICGEAWQDNQLVGAVYGVHIGKVLYGESMFASKTNASKFAFIKLIEYLMANHDLQLIDCQQPSPHLLSLGARTIPITDFKNLLEKHVGQIIIA